MKWRKHRPPHTPKENRVRNCELIVKGSKPTLRDRVMLAPSARDGLPRTPRTCATICRGS